jgi:hypothetical protein
MKRSYWILVLLGFLVASAGAAYYGSRPEAYPGLACSDQRVATFGWTNEDKALAEMAAILRWKQKTMQQGAEYANWHNARHRYLKCRTIGGPNGHYQCRVAAMPCRRADDEPPA